MAPPTLTTDRLLITGLSLEHWEAFAKAWADPRMTEFIGGMPRTRNESWGKFLHGIGLWSLFDYGYWAFVDRENGAFLGNGGLAQSNAVSPNSMAFRRLDGLSFPMPGTGASLPKACPRSWHGPTTLACLKRAALSIPITPPRITLRPNWVIQKLQNRAT